MNLNNVVCFIVGNVKKDEDKWDIVYGNDYYIKMI